MWVKGRRLRAGVTPCPRRMRGTSLTGSRAENLSPRRRGAGVRCWPLDQWGANPTAAAVRTRPRCQRVDTSPCPLLTGEGSPRCPRPVRRRHCIARRGCGEARLPSPLGGEGGSAKPRRMRADRVSGVARASVQRRRPHPPLPGHLLPRGEKERGVAFLHKLIPALPASRILPSPITRTGRPSGGVPVAG